MDSFRPEPITTASSFSESSIEETMDMNIFSALVLGVDNRKAERLEKMHAKTPITSRGSICKDVMTTKEAKISRCFGR